MMQSSTYDAVVVGAGPAGCAAASILARAGREVLLLERDEGPRFKVGESLMPETYRTFVRMGALEGMKRSRFVHKHSVQFFAKSGKASAPFYFSSERADESAQTWQVLRSEFDQLLFENAAAQGAECHRGADVRDVLVDGGRVVGVRVAGVGGVAEVGARVVVDATGQSCLCAKRFDLGRVDYSLDHASIFTHYRGAWRDRGVDEGATLILHSRDADSWFWYIPLPDDVVSVGVVGGVDYLIRGRGSSPAATFLEEVEKCAPVAERLTGAQRCRPVSVLKDFSYRCERIAGEGWVLVGDAFSFIDPVYSSGVFLALKSGELAADAILDAFHHDDFSGERLGSFQSYLMTGVDAVRCLVESFYRRDFSFGAFLRAHPEHRRAVTRILTGDVFDHDFEELFAAMDASCSAPAAV